MKSSHEYNSINMNNIASCLIILCLILITIACGGGGDDSIVDSLSVETDNSSQITQVSEVPKQVSDTVLGEETIFDSALSQYRRGDVINVAAEFDESKYQKGDARLSKTTSVSVKYFLADIEVGEGNNGQIVEIDTDEVEAGLQTITAKLYVDSNEVQEKSLGAITLTEPILNNIPVIAFHEHANSPKSIFFGQKNTLRSKFIVDSQAIVDDKDWRTFLISREVIRKKGKLVKKITLKRVLKKESTETQYVESILTWQARNHSNNLVTPGKYRFIHYAKLVKEHKVTGQRVFVGNTADRYTGNIEVKKTKFTTATLSKNEITVNLDYNERKVRTVYISNKGKNILHFSGVNKFPVENKPNVTLNSPEGDVNPNDRIPLRIAVSSRGALPGLRSYNIPIIINNKANPKLNIKVNVHTKKYGLISFSSDRLDFGSVLNNESKKLPIRIENPGSRSTTINRIVFNNPSFSLSPSQVFPLSIEPNSHLDLDVEFMPQNNGWVKANMHVYSDAVNAHHTNIVLYGQGYLEGKSVSLSNDRMRFWLKAGKSTESLIRLINSGYEDKNYTLRKEFSFYFKEDLVPVIIRIDFPDSTSTSPLAVSEQEDSTPSMSEDVFKADHRKGEFIVVYKNQEALSLQSLKLSNLKLKIKRVLSKVKTTRAQTKVQALNFTKKHIVLMSVAEGMDLKEVRKELLKDPNIASVEPNYIIDINQTPDDYEFNHQWALHNSGQTGGTIDADIDAPEAWEIFRGNRYTRIGVIDTGIDYNHPDLRANMWTNHGEIPGNGIDDDNNGYIDDVHGYDFANNDGDPMDGNGHGTHSAGTIAAVGNNEIGVTGVLWNADLIALKFIRDDGTGTLADAIEALMYANAMGISITSNSWGFRAHSQVLANVLSETDALGYTFVAAAGNNGNDNDASPIFPASYGYDCIISVGASNHNDELSLFSNFGATHVDLAAPGSSILSTMPNEQYGFKSGTSMAAPHVAAAFAMLRGYSSSFSRSYIKETLLNSVDSKDSMEGKFVSGGRLNLSKAMGAIEGQWLKILPMSGVIKGQTFAELKLSLNSTGLIPGYHYMGFVFDIEGQEQDLDFYIVLHVIE